MEEREQVDSSPRGVGLRRGSLTKTSSTFRAPRKNVVTEDSKYVGSVHSYHEEEKEGLVDYINGLLRIHNRPPINTKSNDIFEIVKDGVLLCKLVNAIQPGALDEAKMNNKDKLSIFEKGENQMLALRASQDAFNISFVNIGVEDLLEGRPVLVLSVLWQLVNVDLRTRVRVHSREIEYLVSDKEESSDDVGSPEPTPVDLPEELKILLRWVNHHLAAANSDRRIHNFTNDLKDSVAFIVLLHQLAPESCTLDALNESNQYTRASLVLQSAERIGCKKFLNPDDILQGNSRLNFAFLAYLFTKFNQPKPPSLGGDEQVIELADIHIQSQQILTDLSKAEGLSKESSLKLVQARADAKKEERILENRIADIEDKRKAQTDLYTAKIETLKQAVADAKSAQLPSVPELKAAIAVEQAEQEAILKEREETKEKIIELKVDVVARTATRNREERLLSRVNNELQTIEAGHAEKKKEITDKIDALGIETLQKKLDNAISQSEEISKKNEVLNKKRETLNERIGTERVTHSKASEAVRKAKEELVKAKKDLDDASTKKVATVAASSRFERKIVDLKNEITKDKKEVIFIDYQIETAKEDAEDVKAQTKKIGVEVAKLASAKEQLAEEVYETKQILREETRKTELDVKKLTAKNEQILEVNRKKNTAEILVHQEEKEKLSGDLSNVMKDYNTAQVELSYRSRIAEIRGNEVRGLQRELTAVQDETKELERTAAKILKNKEYTNTLVAAELSTKENEEKELLQIQRETEALQKNVNKKLLKRNDLEYEANMKLAEADQMASLVSNVANHIDRQPELSVKNDEKWVAAEEKIRKEIIQEKEHAHKAAINKEKENYERKIRQGGITVVKDGAGHIILETLENDVAKLKQEREALARQEKLAARDLKELQSETAQIRAENKKLLQANVQTNNVFGDKKHAVENESKSLSRVKTVSKK